MRPLRILHVEDNDDDALLIADALRRDGLDCDIERVETRAALGEAVAVERFDAVLSDFRLAGFDGFAVIETVRERAPQCPIILVTGTIGEERAAEALKQGATDFLLKHRLERLGPAVRRALAEASERERRTALEAQLRQAQKLEAVGRLTGAVAHDFNNLLTAILGSADLVLMELPQDSPLREDLETIRDAGKRGAALTRQLLAFSRKQDLQPRELDLNDLLRNMETLLRRMSREDVRLLLSLVPDPPRVRADPGHLEQVIANLVVNARDAMPDGGTLVIETTAEVFDTDRAAGFAEAAPGRYVRLAVRDTGTGMDEATLAQIFEPFFTTKGEGKGTGLGLATCYGIVKQSGGFIHVRSAPGKGTAFEVFLPAV